MHKRVFSILIVLAVLTSGLPVVILLGDTGIVAQNGSDPELEDPEGLVISALMSDPLPGEPEFVEIYNPTFDPILLEGVGIRSDHVHVFEFLETETLGALLSVRVIFGEGEDGFNSSRMMYDRYTNMEKELITDSEGLLEIVAGDGEVIDALEYSRDGNINLDSDEDLWYGPPAENGPTGTALGRISFQVPSTADQWMKGSPLINEIHFGDSGFIELFNPGGQVDLDLLGFFGHDDFDLSGKLEQDTYLIIPITSSHDEGIGGFGSSIYSGEPIGTEILDDGQIGLELNGVLIDYVRFEKQTDDGIESSTLYQMANSQGRWTDTGNDPDVQFTSGQTIGRDQVSTDTDSWEDWSSGGGKYSNGPTPGNRNIFSLCFLYIDNEGSFILTNYGETNVNLSGIKLLNWDGSKFDLPDVEIPPIAELKIIPNSTGTDDLYLSDLNGTYHIPDWEGREGEYGLTLLVLDSGSGEIFIDMITWSPGITRSWLSDAVDWVDDNIVQPARRTVREVARVVVDGIRRSVNWVREQFNRLKGVFEDKIKELLEEGVDIGDYLNLSLTIIKDGWRFTVTASTPEAQLRFPPFPLLSLLVSAEGSVYVQKDCNGLTFGGEVVLRVHIGFNEDWGVVEIRLTGGVSLVINYPDEATVADSHCSSVNAAVGFTLNLEFWASINQPQLDIGASFEKTWELWKDSIPVGPKGYGCDCDRRPRARADPEPDDPFRPPGATTGGEDEQEENFEREFGVSVENRCDHERQLNITTTTSGDSYVYPQSTIADMDTGEEITIPTALISGPSAGPASRPGIGPGDTGGPGGLVPGGGKNPPEEKDPKNYNGVTSGKVKKVCEGSVASFDVNVTNFGEVLTEYVTVTMTDTTNSSYTNSTTFPVRFKEPIELLYDAPPGWEVRFYHPGIGYIDDIKGLDENETRQLKVVVMVPEGTPEGNYDVTIRVRLRYHTGISDRMQLKLRVVDELNTIWQDGFEAPQGPWTFDGDFQMGIPTLGPGVAAEGLVVATTVLSGYYNNDTVSTLRTNDIPLTRDDMELLTLSFWHYIDVAGAFDNCTVWVHAGSDSFRLDKFTEDIGVWRREVYDLSNLSVGTIAIEFRFETDSFFSEPGWFIDNVSLLSCGRPSDLSIVKVDHLTYNVTNNGTDAEMNVEVRLYDYSRAGQILYSTAFLENDWTFAGWKSGVRSIGIRKAPMLYMESGSGGTSYVQGISLVQSTSPTLSFYLYQSYDPEDELLITLRSPNRTREIRVNGSIGVGWKLLEYDISSFAGEMVQMSINQSFSGKFDGYPVAVSGLKIAEGYAVEDHKDSTVIPTILPGDTVTVEFDPYIPDIPGEHLRRAEVLRTCDKDLSDNIHEETYWSPSTSGSGLSHDIPMVLSPGDEILIEDALYWSASISVILETVDGNLSLGSKDGSEGWVQFNVPVNVPGGDCTVWIESENPAGDFIHEIEGRTISGPSPVSLGIDSTGNYAGEIVSFLLTKGGSDAEVLNVLWDFGEGNMTAEEAPEHIYMSTGSFTVILWANFERYGLVMVTKEITLLGDRIDVTFKVTDEAGEPVEGADVTLGSVEGSTGASGEVLLRSFRTGTFEWRVEGPGRFGIECYQFENGTLQLNSTENRTVEVQLDYRELPFSLQSPQDMRIRNRSDLIVFNFTGDLRDNYTDGEEPVSLLLDGEDWEPVVDFNGSLMGIQPNGGMYYGKDIILTVKGGPTGPLWKNGSVALCRDVVYGFTWEIPDDKILFGPLEGYEGHATLKVVDEERNMETYGSDSSGTFLIPKDSEGKYALFDSDFFGVSLEGTISEDDGRLTLTDAVNASQSPEVKNITFYNKRITIEFSQVMNKGTEEFDIDMDGLKGDFNWNGRILHINITGGYTDGSREKFTVKVLSTATSMWGVPIREEASIEIDRKDLIVEGGEDEEEEEDDNVIVWIVLVILVVLFLSIIVVFILSRKGSAEDEEGWEE